MKKFFRYASVVAFAMTMSLGFTSCSDDDDPDNNEPVKLEQMEAIAKQYVNNVVYPTYTDLANSTEALYNQIVTLRDHAEAGTLTNEEINEACSTFLTARAYWEKSEAWLYGPADQKGIDPHIDTWPLSKPGLATFFRDQYDRLFVQSTDVNAQIEAVSSLNDESSWLGFHGLEFILFRGGENRNVANFMGNEDDSEFVRVNPNVTGAMELNLAVAIAGDLRDHCYWLECSWMGTSANQSHIARCNERNFDLTIDGQYTGAALTTLGLTSSYTTWRQVMTEILNAGCMNICNEVAQQKMGQVWRCATGNQVTEGEEPDSPDYIESPYSHKSFEDFYDNIVSIKNALYGNIDGQSYHANSIMAYLTAHNAGMAEEVQTKLDASFDALSVCLEGRPFVSIAYGGSTEELATVKAAMDAIDELNTTLNEATEWIQRN